MPVSQMNKAIQQLHKTVVVQDAADGHLLECFVSRHEQAALEVLVRRHGPMVWGVCRRVLKNYHDAEDAFQATFLVLVRKAASIAPKELLGNWLYGVAHQTALKARATAAKRKTRECQVPALPEASVQEQEVWSDLYALLDQELSSLPERYRAAILLCDLEGRTQKEAARQIGCPEGTIATHLARGRALLAKRMARHGLAVSGGSVAAVLVQSASAGVPASAVCSTISAMTLFAAGQSAMITVRVIALTEGVLEAMLLRKLMTAAAVILLLAMISVGTLATAMLASGHANQPATQKNPGKKPQDQTPATPKGGQIDDDKTIQGEWRVVAFEREGANRTDALKDVLVTITQNVILIHDKLGLEAKKSAFKLASNHSPKWIDLSPDYGEFKGQQTAGIYALEKGRLRICIIERADRQRDVKDRPTQFKTNAGDGLGLLTLERVNPKNADTKKESGLKAKTAKQEWLDEFQRFYVLKDGEVLKRIAAPYPECREKLFDEKATAKPGTAFLNTDTTYLFFRYQNKKTVLGTQHGYGRLPIANPPPAALSFILERGLHFPLQHVEALGDLLATNIDGEFVFRSGTSPEHWVPAFDKILRTESNLPIKLTLKEIDRDVIVLSGPYQSKPRNGQMTNTIVLSPVDPTNEWSGSGIGTYDDFVRFLNQFANKYVVSEVKDPPKGQFWWRHASGTMTSDDTGRYTYDGAPAPEMIFKLVAEQTGLTFTMAKRKVRVLFVEKTN